MKKISRRGLRRLIEAALTFSDEDLQIVKKNLKGEGGAASAEVALQGVDIQDQDPEIAIKSLLLSDLLSNLFKYL